MSRRAEDVSAEACVALGAADRQLESYPNRELVVHHDSLGSESILRPGGVNVMTSGAGIAHAEQTPRDHTGRLNGVQLWVALPDQHRHTAAAFEYLRGRAAVALCGDPFRGGRPLTAQKRRDRVKDE